MTRALQSTRFQNPGGVGWAWRTKDKWGTEILVSNIGLSITESPKLKVVKVSFLKSLMVRRKERKKFESEPENLCSPAVQCLITVKFFSKVTSRGMQKIWLNRVIITKIVWKAMVILLHWSKLLIKVKGSWRRPDL